MKTTIIAALVGAVLLATPAQSMAYPAAATLTIDGHGRAHGVGLCMGGVLGRVRAGQNYQTIIKHYYTGVTIGPSGSIPARVKVKLCQGTFAVAGDQGTQSFDVQSSSGTTLLTVNAGQKATIWMESGHYKLSVTSRSGASRTSLANIDTPNPLTLVPTGGTILQVAKVSATYNHFRGNVIAIKGPEGLCAVNDVAMEDYLKGIGEEPESVPTQMLITTSLVARTYAAFRVIHNKFAGEPYQLVAGPESQLYLGYDYEKNSPKLAAAVAATAGKVVLYHSQPILAAYFSNCGGHTEDSKNAFGTDYPYLKGVWCNEKDHSKPYCRTYHGHRWSVRTSFATLAKKLGVHGEILGFSNWVRGFNKSPTGSPRVYSLKVRATGGSKTKSGYDVQNAYALQSNWFYFLLPPTIGNLSASGGGTVTRFSFGLSATARVTLAVSKPKGGLVVKKTLGVRGKGTVRYDWNRRDAHGRKVAKGKYVVRVDVRDGRGNVNFSTKSFSLAGGSASAASVLLSRTIFSPAAWSIVPTIAATYSVGEAGSGSLVIKDSAGSPKRTLVPLASMGSGTRTAVWDGKDDTGTVVADGRYAVVLTDKVVAKPVQVVSVLVVVDTVRPVVTGLVAVPATFSATVGTGTAIGFRTDETGTATVVIHQQEGARAGVPVRTIARVAAPASMLVQVAWNGKGAGDSTLTAPATYFVEATVTDAAGNPSQPPDPGRLTDYLPVGITP